MRNKAKVVKENRRKKYIKVQNSKIQVKFLIKLCRKNDRYLTLIYNQILKPNI